MCWRKLLLCLGVTRMTAQELKNSILQWAIQGKLVGQRAEEGTAKELIEQIKAEKEQLIKDKKIKKEKPLPEITEDEIPFDIPENWEWVRLKQIAISIKAGGDKPKEFSEIKTQEYVIPVIANGIKNDGIIGYTNKATVEEKCITVSARGTIGFSCIRREPFSPVVRLLVLCMSNKISYEYIQVVLSVLLEKGVGTSIQQLTVPMLEPKLIPIPPIEEQKRIVEKVEELLPYVEQYDKAYTKLEVFNKKFPEDMQKSILQYAIQGKLVEQRAEEGTAEELYQQIQEEKARLIKEGKIKKEKPLSEITEDEIPFDIPEKWKWVKIGNLAWYLDAGKSPNCIKENVKNDEWGVITTTAIQTNYFDQHQNKTLPKDFIIKPEMQVKVGDVLITRAGPTNRTGVACFVADIKYNLILSDKTVRINLSNDYINKEFITLAINSPGIRKFIINLMSGMDKQQVNISQDKIKNIIVPLPPLGEQKRIVAKIEEILPCCKQLIK